MAAHARRSGLTREQAEDVVQATMIKVATHLPTFEYRRTACRFRTWLNQIVNQRILAIWHEQRRARLPEAAWVYLKESVAGVVNPAADPVAPARLEWRRVREKGFTLESWQGHAGTADWVRGQMCSFCVDLRGRTFQALDLARFTVVGTLFPDGPPQPVSTILHPQSRELWLIAGGNGEVFALDPGTLKLRSLGGGSCDDRHFGSLTYWNPITGRVGILGGYGHLAVRNDRCEFDPGSRSWLELEPDREDSGPWRRCGWHLFPDATSRGRVLSGGGRPGDF